MTSMCSGDSDKSPGSSSIRPMLRLNGENFATSSRKKPFGIDSRLRSVGTAE